MFIEIKNKAGQRVSLAIDKILSVIETEKGVFINMDDDSSWGAIGSYDDIMKDIQNKKKVRV